MVNNITTIGFILLCQVSVQIREQKYQNNIQNSNTQ